jgi:hypothetical protein
MPLLARPGRRRRVRQAQGAEDGLHLRGRQAGEVAGAVHGMYQVVELLRGDAGQQFLRRQGWPEAVAGLAQRVEDRSHLLRVEPCQTTGAVHGVDEVVKLLRRHAGQHLLRWQRVPRLAQVAEDRASLLGGQSGEVAGRRGRLDHPGQRWPLIAPGGAERLQ